MKTLIAITALLLAACAEKPPVAVPIAPTVPVRPASKPVDLAPVSRDLGPVAESNRQLYQQIVEGKQSIYELNKKLKTLEAGRVATIEEWNRLTDLGKATERALTESERIQAEQRKSIEALQLTVADKTIEVQLGEVDKEALRKDVEVANGRIIALTNLQQAAAEAAQVATVKVEAEKAKTATERTWKWRFFGWATLTTISTALLTYLLVKPRFL
jgi:hypothetical protein